MPRIIFMGTPQFAQTVLQGLIDEKYDVIGVVTQPDRPVGRKRVLTPSPVKELALKYNIPVYQPERIGRSEELQELIDLEADLIITAAYGQFVPTKLLNAPKYKSINVHASLLPKYRGGAPIHYAIWNGDDETGVSIMYMIKEMDAGDIISQKRIKITSQDDVGTMFEKLALLGRDLLLETLPAIFNETIEPIPQDEEKVTFSPTIPREKEQINWEQTAQEVDYHVRAFRPFPSTYTWLNDQRVKIWAGHPVEGTFEKAPVGTIVSNTKEALIVQCGKETYYAVTSWQESGRQRVDIKDFVNGQRLEEVLGQQFEYKASKSK
ncbi:methionyl-tRNA formyltransferase [Dolosicoccus paucivorans]|uniref:Methionyl-tRNA formyltransferase n=1 Tax=Dolosicoccus paucivorans TaxID=84521 RepID=A0A1G8JDJ0_9LACT|nr:methionyl-tRNA formyltransferase [Dolosicoccus paucivorans]PMC58393.1 methionyl-tRNA formyltransferase [Dolosicoccus paucivorans]SDI29192.1 methionyl-tRNA formyltransferase [Dolosicoccus paucivorans]